MEEILASIRKIIADDDALPLTRSSAPPRLFETNVTPFAPPPPPQVAPEAASAPAEPAAPENSLEAAVAVHAPEPVSIAPEPEVAYARTETQLDASEMESFAEVGRELARFDGAEASVEEEETVALRPALDAADIAPQAIEDDADVAPVPHELPYDEPVADETVLAPEPPRFTEAAHAYADVAQPAPEPQAPTSMLSAEANASVASAFQALSASVQMASAESIDRHVREMLRPMLKQWLDDNLPGMVERLVRAEIERVARGGR